MRGKSIQNMIDERTIQRVTDAASIVDVVGTFLELKPVAKGKRYTCLCPFHEDRHVGNFVVYPRKNVYKCFACDAKGGPVQFLMEHEKLSYPDAIRWLGKKYNIDVEGADRFDVSPSKPHTPPPPLPTLYLKTRMVEARSSTDNTFCRWLRGLPWTASQRARVEDILSAYRVGTNKWGDAIFWQIDQNGGIRDGKFMRYLPDGHRDKNNRYSIGWASATLFRADVYDEDAWEVRRCLYGLHQLNQYPTAEVHIVESEKTAIFCAIYYGQPERHLWMATAGKSNLSAEILRPLIEQRRTIALHPDKDAKEAWTDKLTQIGYKRAYINDSVLTLQWKPEDGEKADIADVLMRVMEEERRDRTVKKLADIMPSVGPAVKMLVDKYNLEEENGSELQDDTDEGVELHP